MYTSFYTAARGAIEQQRRLDVVSNNIANVNNYGYKSKNAVFSDLMYYNLNNYRGEETPLKAGTGVVVEKTNTNFDPAGFLTTDRDYDYAINGEGFFMLRNPVNNTVTYTRNGRFSMSQRGNEFYLVNDNGNFVLDQNRNPIRVTQDGLSAEIGVYGFNILDGMQSVGDNEFAPIAKNGNPYLIQGAELVERTLESPGVDLADEISKVIESQRAYAYSLRMVRTSDEIVTTINSLRA